MIHLLDVHSGINQTELSRVLWQHRISHRIMEHEGRQLLLIASENKLALAHDLYRRVQQGEIIPAPEASGGLLAALLPTGGSLQGLSTALNRSPLTLALVLACIALAFLAPLHRPTALTWALLYPDFSFGTRIIDLSRVVSQFTLEHFLRMLSPILLHAGAMHLVFNMLWLWELGKRIEQRQGSLWMLLTLVVLALLSNTAQYLYGGGNNFGGMSGVVYGLFAYVWMWQLFNRAAGLWLPRALIGFFLLSLLIMTWLQLDMIANEAHLGGFLAGMLFGALTASIGRLRGRDNERR
ncbi:MAG TPA: rhomboid family intramembrane serine protease [Pseudomonadaceae bacterium]|nr:rhomboid family intramembrane serine protease [Pseudomonadaceae bacterium]